MNNYCWFCGNKINADDKKCSVCDADIFTDRVNVEEKRKEFAEIKKKENMLFFLTLLLPVCSVVCGMLDVAVFSPLLLIGSLAALVFLRKKYYYSRKVKILSSLVLLGVVFFIGFIVWICIECGIIHPGL